VKQPAWIGLSLPAMFVFDRISAARVGRLEAEIAMMKQGPVTGGVMSTERDGSARSAFYFAREGTQLPDMP
jgi:hypothetical protein